jgi:hypothetical protein
MRVRNYYILGNDIALDLYDLSHLENYYMKSTKNQNYHLLPQKNKYYDNLKK